MENPVKILIVAIAGTSTCGSDIAEMQLPYTDLVASLARHRLHAIPMGVVTHAELASLWRLFEDREAIDGVILCAAPNMPISQIRKAVQLLDKPACLVPLISSGLLSAGQVAPLPGLPWRLDKPGLRGGEDAGVAMVETIVDGDAACAELGRWPIALSAAKHLRQTSVGIICRHGAGVPAVAMRLPALSGKFGLRFELLDSAEFMLRRDSLEPARLERKRIEMERLFAIDAGCHPPDIEAALKTACALDELVWTSRCSALVYCGGDGGSQESRLIERTLRAGSALLNLRGIPVVGRGNVNALVARQLLGLLAGRAMCAELYGAQFDRESTLWSLDEMPYQLMTGQPRAVIRDGGNAGLTLASVVDPGPVTVLAVVEPTPGECQLQYAHGWGENASGPAFSGRLAIQFGGRAGDFIRRWQHLGTDVPGAVVPGHCGRDIELLARLLSLKAVDAGSGPGMPAA